MVWAILLHPIENDLHILQYRHCGGLPRSRAKLQIRCLGVFFPVLHFQELREYCICGFREGLFGGNEGVNGGKELEEVINVDKFNAVTQLFDPRLGDRKGRIWVCIEWYVLLGWLLEDRKGYITVKLRTGFGFWQSSEEIHLGWSQGFDSVQHGFR